MSRIIVVEGNDVSIFHDIAAAECYLEPVDIPLFKGFTDQGHAIQFNVKQVPKRSLFFGDYCIDSVAIKVDNASEASEQLTNILIDYLLHLGHANETLRHLSLSELVNLAYKYAHCK